MAAATTVLDAARLDALDAALRRFRLPRTSGLRSLLIIRTRLRWAGDDTLPASVGRLLLTFLEPKGGAPAALRSPSEREGFRRWRFAGTKNRPSPADDAVPFERNLERSRLWDHWLEAASERAPLVLAEFPEMCERQRPHASDAAPSSPAAVPGHGRGPSETSGSTPKRGSAPTLLAPVADAGSVPARLPTASRLAAVKAVYAALSPALRAAVVHSEGGGNTAGSCAASSRASPSSAASEAGRGQRQRRARTAHRGRAAVKRRRRKRKGRARLPSTSRRRCGRTSTGPRGDVLGPRGADVPPARAEERCGPAPAGRRRLLPRVRARRRRRRSGDVLPDGRARLHAGVDAGEPSDRPGDGPTWAIRRGGAVEARSAGIVVGRGGGRPSSGGAPPAGGGERALPPPAASRRATRRETSPLPCALLAKPCASPTAAAPLHAALPPTCPTHDDDDDRLIPLTPPSSSKFEIRPCTYDPRAEDPDLRLTTAGAGCPRPAVWRCASADCRVRTCARCYADMRSGW